LRLAIYRQSVRLVAKPFETHDQTFLQLKLDIPQFYKIHDKYETLNILLLQLSEYRNKIIPSQTYAVANETKLRIGLSYKTRNTKICICWYVTVKALEDFSTPLVVYDPWIRNY
jgi:hypothetical protein